MTSAILPHNVVRIRPRQALLAREERLAAMFPLARQIIDAPSHAARAGLVLRFSDEIVLGHFAALWAACTEAGFGDGRGYLLERYAALMATRDEYGLMRDVRRLELFRRGLAALAHGPHCRPREGAR